MKPIKGMAANWQDDLLWMHAVAYGEGLSEVMDQIISDYTDDPNIYSDGSIVWEPFNLPPVYYSRQRAVLHLPPHRRTRELTGHVHGFKFLSAEIYFSPTATMDMKMRDNLLPS